MTRSVTLAIFLSASMLALHAVDAHEDDHSTHFVANSGVDEGDCDESAVPCRSISYALSVLSKGGSLKVATGLYEVSDADTVFHLAADSLPITGGFDAATLFETATGEPSVLVGVPLEYAEPLSRRGFHVIADPKGIDRELAERTSANVAVHQSLKSSIPATPCVGGTAAGLPCSNVDLLSHVASGEISARPGDAADVWGFMDLNTNREYAFVGFGIGTAVFDVTDAEMPREVGFIAGRATIWRDIKVYQFHDTAQDRWRAYAYVTADGTTDGLTIIDLSDLPHAVRKVDYASDYSAAHNVFVTGTDYATGIALGSSLPRLVIAGSNNGSGPYRAYDLASPEAPAFTVMPGSGRGDYSHDVASAVISDARKVAYCIDPAAAWCELLFDFNEATFDIWDVTDPNAPLRLSTTSYGGASYVHSGWITEDARFLFVHDELDERQIGLPTTLRVFDLDNLAAPAFAGNWTGPTSAIDHNGFVRGNRYYMSNYSHGLTVLDITNPAAPVSVGGIDTFPATDVDAFVGAWGTYPFLPSGNIAISDIDSGFYMVADRSLDVAQGRLAFSAPSFGSSEGGQIDVTVERIGGSAGAVSVGYEIVPGTAGTDDVGQASGRLQWADGDSGAQTISIAAVADGNAEPLERLLLRLVSPTGGATLGPSSLASLYVGEPAQQSAIGFDLAEVTVTERGFATAVVVVKRSGSAVGAVSADFSVSGGSAVAGTDYVGAASGTVRWADGDADPKWIEYAIVDDGATEPEESFSLVLGNPVGAMLGAKSVMQVKIAANGSAPPSPNPPRRNRSGGGAADWLFVVLLLAARIAAARTSPTRRGAA